MLQPQQAPRTGDLPKAQPIQPLPQHALPPNPHSAPPSALPPPPPPPLPPPPHTANGMKTTAPHHHPQPIEPRGNQTAGKRKQAQRDEETQIAEDVQTTKRGRGRPPGSKNRRRRAEANPSAIATVGAKPTTDPQPCSTPRGKKGRGASFTADEALSLAKAWVEQIEKALGQFEGNMWTAIRIICMQKYAMTRTTESLRCAWMRIARESRHFIAAQTKVRTQAAAHIRGKMTSEADLAVAVMELYRKSAGKLDVDGVFQYAPPFKYVSTADFLATQPRFEVHYSSSSVSASLEVDGTGGVGVKEAHETDKHGKDHIALPGSVAEARDNRHREVMHSGQNGLDDGMPADGDAGQTEFPSGAKRRKTERGESENGDDHGYDNDNDNDKETGRGLGDVLTDICSHISKWNMLLAEATDVARMAGYDNTDVRLLEVLDKGSADYKEILADVMRARRERVSARR